MEDALSIIRFVEHLIARRWFDSLLAFPFIPPFDGAFYEYQDASLFFQVSLAGSGLGARGYFANIIEHSVLTRSIGGTIYRLGGCGF